MCGASTTSPEPEEGVQAPEPAAQEISAGASKPLTQATSGEIVGEKKGGAGLLWGIAALAFVGLLVGSYFLLSKLRVDPVAAPDNGSMVPTEEAAQVPSAAAAPIAGDPRTQEEVTKVLNDFFKAKTAEEKAQYVIGGASRADEIREFYASEERQGTKLAAENFIAFPMEQSDKDRGIFLMDYHRPKQFKLSEFFRPIASMEIQMQVETPSIIVWSGALLDNFEMEAQRARAFFKKIDGVYKLDWDTLVQTQFRTLRDFTDYPSPGSSGVFRVFVIEDVTTTMKKNPDLRVYRVVDAAHVDDDQVTVEVPQNSEVGQLLAPFNWTDQPGKTVQGTTATVRLKWTDDPEPELVIDEIICWEFLNIGGDPSNLAENPVK